MAAVHGGPAAPLGAIRWLAVVAVVLATVGALGTLVETVVIGHSGAAAAWSQVGSTS